MSGDDFSLLPQRIPDREYVIFKKWLLARASEEQSEHLFTDRYADLGLSLKYLFEVYEAGKERKIPEAWIPLYKQMKTEESAEYQTYLRLKEKYEDQHLVSQLFLDNTFHPQQSEQEVDLEKEASSKKRKKGGSSGREFKKDGKVTSFY